MRTLPASRHLLLFRSNAPEDPSSSTSPSTSSQSTHSPLTPPPLLPRQSLYPFITLSYDGVRHSLPIHARALSMAPSSSPPNLPYGKASPPRPSARPLRKGAPSGLGLVDVEKLAAAPSVHADASREQRAQRRRAVDFYSHAQFSEAHLVNLARPDGARIPPELLHAPAGVPPRAHGHGRDGADDAHAHAADFSWEAEVAGLSPRTDAGIDALASPCDSVRDITAAFPVPPTSTPEFPLSLASGFALEGPPNMPLPPTPPLRSPHIFASIAYTDSPGDNRLTVVDPDESMARLQLSMAKLQAYNEPFHNGYFFEDDDNEDNEEEEEGEEEEDWESEHGPTDSGSEERCAPLQTICEDPREAKLPRPEEHKHEHAPQARPSPARDELADSRPHVLSPSTFARVGFAPRRDSLSSVASPSTVAEESHASSRLSGLPRFDFERAHQLHADGHRRRSSSLSDIRKPLRVHWLDQPADQRDGRPSESSASSYSHDSSGAGAGAGGLSVPGRGLAAFPVSTPQPASTSSREPSARPESPLRKTKSTPFIRRQLRPVDLVPAPAPAQRPAPKHFHLRRPHTAPEAAPPVPPPPGSLQHAARLSQLRVHPKPRPQPGSLPHPDADTGASAGTLPWARMGAPGTPPSTGQADADEPDAGSAHGLQSFMHITPEHQASRVSRLWSRAWARAGLGGATGTGAGKDNGNDDGARPLKKEKSMRWLRGASAQAPLRSGG